MDADLYRTVASKHDIVGYPTVKFFPKGSKESTDTFNNERTAEQIVSFPQGNWIGSLLFLCLMLRKNSKSSVEREAEMITTSNER